MATLTWAVSPAVFPESALPVGIYCPVAKKNEDKSMRIHSRIKMPGCVRPLADYGKVSDPLYADILLSTGLHLASAVEAERLIESFVDHAVHSNRRAVRFRNRVTGYHVPGPTVIGRHLLQALRLLGLFSSDCDHSPKVYAFLEACWALESVYEVDFTDVALNPHWHLYTHADALDAILSKIRSSARQPWLGGIWNDEFNMA